MKGKKYCRCQDFSFAYFLGDYFACVFQLEVACSFVRVCCVCVERERESHI